MKTEVRPYLRHLEGNLAPSRTHLRQEYRRREGARKDPRHNAEMEDVWDDLRWKSTGRRDHILEILDRLALFRRRLRCSGILPPLFG